MDEELRDILKDIKERYAYGLPVPLPDVKWLLNQYEAALAREKSLVNALASVENRLHLVHSVAQDALKGYLNE